MNNKYNKKELIYLLRKKVKELKRTPKAKEINEDKDCPHSDTYIQHFGSWNNALIKSGLKINKKIYSKGEILNFLKNKIKELGKVPSVREINKYKNFPSEIVFRRYFGRYNGALKEIGFKPNVIRDYTKEKLIISLENLKKELKRTPKLKDFRNKSLNAPSECTYFKYFKSFNNALKEAGIKINRRRDYTNEELIDCLKNEAEKLRRTPTAVEVQKSRNCPGINTYKEHFGTYNKAVLLAGLKRNRGYNGEKWKFWQKHCEDMARVLYSNVIIQAKLKDIRGNPDILIPKENKFIDAKTSGYNDFKDQIKRYVIKNGASLEFWCIFKGIETKHPKVKYIYANELAMRMDKIGRKDLAIKCCQFLTGSEDQKLLVVK